MIIFFPNIGLRNGLNEHICVENELRFSCVVTVFRYYHKGYIMLKCLENFIGDEILY